MIDGLVQAFITIEFADFDSGTQDYFGAVLLQLGRKIIRLGQSARDHHSPASEGLGLSGALVVLCFLVGHDPRSLEYKLQLAACETTQAKSLYSELRYSSASNSPAPCARSCSASRLPSCSASSNEPEI